MNPLQHRFNLWRDRVRFYLKAKRGRTSDLARALGVRRQTVWRWFFEHWSNVPGWAAVNVNVWYYERVPRELDQFLAEQQKFGPLGDPQADKFVSRSGDEAPASVSPQADNFVPGSRDKVTSHASNGAAVLNARSDTEGLDLAANLAP